ncbi:MULTISPECIES: tripartite tricarboxylate transporter substrate-binding protein [Bradyrhizobium]|uniref:tripartite tricarboxylate transporter substrate-binding protein n=1 Tax=Bradyrhizobium TaxID=374 RepID=UPI0004107DC6
MLSRLLCQRPSDRLGQTFVVENKPGACSNIGTQVVVHSNAHEFGSMLMAETDRWRKVVELSGVRKEQWEALGGLRQAGNSLLYHPLC